MIEQPDGIILTMPKVFFEDRKMTEDQFKELFERVMRSEDSVWNYRLTNLPKYDVAYVYMAFGGFIQYRCQLVMYERNKEKTFYDAPDRRPRKFAPTNWVILTGPVVKAPYEIPKKGFQGFRYTQKLF